MVVYCCHRSARPRRAADQEVLVGGRDTDKKERGTVLLHLLPEGTEEFFRLMFRERKNKQKRRERET